MKKIYQFLLFCLSSSSTATFSQTISSNAPLCGNQNLTLDLSATGGTAYAWKGPNGFASTQQKPSIKNVNWKNRGIYTVTIDNKTSLTTDVNIKDPVAFTVPKEISVCEGGTLVIEPKSGRLTDSTEVADYYNYRNPLGESIGLPLKNLTSKDAGVYQVTGEMYASRNNNIPCPITQKVNVKVNTNNDCKSIQIEDLSKVKMCYAQEVIIPFTAKGNFKTGTKFKVYVANFYNPNSNDFNKPLMIVEKSPIILNIDKYFDQTIAIVLIADDAEKTTSISNYRAFSSSYFYRNNSINSLQTCDSSKLSVNYPNSINSLQWYVDGNVINGANKNDFVAKKSGIYTFKFKGDNANEAIDKTCLYESQPAKIELGKIDKPIVIDTSSYELCVNKPTTLFTSSTDNVNYRWKKDGLFIPNANKNFFSTALEGNYQIEAKQGNCTALSDTIMIRKPTNLGNFLFRLKIPQTLQLNDQEVYTICDNQEFGFSSIRVPPMAKHQLFKNGEFIREELSQNKFNSYTTKGEGVYSLKLSYGQCESKSNTITVKYNKVLKFSNFSNRVNPIYSSIFYSNDYELCEGQRASLNIESNGSYYKVGKGTIFWEGKAIKDWTVKESLQNSFYFSDNFLINQSGYYYAKGNVFFADGSECSIITDSIKVKFSNVVTERFERYYGYEYDEQNKRILIKICKDSLFNLTGAFQSSPVYSFSRNLSYKWTKDGVTLKQDSSNVLQVNQSGIYQLETTYKGGCKVTSSPFKIDFGKIAINFYSNFYPTICEERTTNLYPILREILDNNVYDFTKDGKTINTNLQEYYNLTQPGTYKLTVKNGKCEGTSPDFVLKIDKIPTTITPTDSVTFCSGKTVELKASTEAGLSYIWERNGSVINQANQATLTASADGLYKATLLRGACWGVTPSVKLKTLANILPTATLTGDQKIDYDKETKLSVNLSSHAPWTFKLSDGKEYTTTKSPFEIAVKPLSTTTYSLTSVSNICGTGTVSGTAKIEVIILSAEEEKDLSVEVFPVPSSEICNWKIQTPEATRASVVLYDITGVTQYTQESATRTQSHEGTINLQNLKPGTYFLKMQVGEKSVTRKVVKY
jgi:Secretion system C-terminal sorting domain